MTASYQHSKTRKATHAGSWYDSQGDVLSSKLKAWLENASPSHAPARAIIAPHAGYSYSGPCAAFAYRQVVPEKVKCVFILGPSHHYYLKTCALASVDAYETPLYNLTINKKIYQELRGAASFDSMTHGDDEAEHSMEMHLPYIAKIMESRRDNFTIVPILVGSLSHDTEAKYGAILAKYLADDENLFVVSSDFCHWGKRFRYVEYDKTKGKIHESIECMDKEGMEIIESLNPRHFASYLLRTENTICGRHPIGVFLNAVDVMRRDYPALQPSMKFTKYAQSSKATSADDSSVSYASGALVVANAPTEAKSAAGAQASR
ncbi:protein MEMO1-like [Sycon ciliatum]|uniref:protein MEMO1-like n=1 Tax=Sycon ciliatum TaxID=27933 RepID=UPI0020A87916|eukprot:scpid83084/ scgid14131/ Protein MEMO1; Mediator of ErbB2-driven cell motility 1